MSIVPEFVEFYNQLPKVRDLRFPEHKKYGDVEYLWKKTGMSPAVCDMQRHTDIIPLIAEYYPFFNEAKRFWVIPVDSFNGEVYGFILRAVFFKKAWLVKEKETPQLTYGWHRFKDWKPDSPLVLTEGAKDGESLAQFYPYVISLLSASISKGLAELLMRLTTKFVIALDGDTAGVKATTKIQKSFMEVGINPRILRVPTEIKDWGDMLTMDIGERVRNAVDWKI